MKKIKRIDGELVEATIEKKKATFTHVISGGNAILDMKTGEWLPGTTCNGLFLVKCIQTFFPKNED